MGSDSAFGEPFYSIKDSGTRHEFNTGAVRDIQLKLSDISPGDIIEHESWGCNHGGMRERLTRRKGKVIQVTDKVITLQGKNYPETLLVNDLLSGRAKILKVRGEDTMARYYWKALWPQAQELLAQGLSTAKVAEKLGIDTPALRCKIDRERRKAKQQTPSPAPAEAANQEPVQEAVEPAEPSITPEETKEVTLPPKNDGFGPGDDEPIPYVPVDLRDLIAELREDLDLERHKVAALEKKMELLASALPAGSRTSQESRLAKLLVAVFRELG